MDSTEVSPPFPKCLTVRQPWAELIADGRKGIETRAWSTKYRGPLLIHAAQHPVLKAPEASAFGLEAAALDYGAIIASCRLVDVRPMVAEDRAQALTGPFPDYYSWVLADVRRVEPFHCPGKQGFWHPPEAFQSVIA